MNEYRALGMGGLPLAKCCLTPVLLVFRERSWSRTQMRVLHILNTSLLKCGLHTRQYFVFRCLLDFERIFIGFRTHLSYDRVG